MRQRLLLPGMTVLLAICGCGKNSAQLPVFPVTGEVTYDGAPASGVHVYLLPMNAPTFPTIPSNPHGITGADGRFKITTYAAGDGAPPGSYLVVFIWPDETRRDDEEPPDLLLGWYDASHTQLNVTVPEAPTILEAFHLPAQSERPSISAGIPGRN